MAAYVVYDLLSLSHVLNLDSDHAECPPKSELFQCCAVGNIDTLTGTVAHH